MSGLFSLRLLLLFILIGQAVMLSEKSSDAATRDRAETIVEAAERCGRIVKTYQGTDGTDEIVFAVIATSETVTTEPKSYIVSLSLKK